MFEYHILLVEGDDREGGYQLKRDKREDGWREAVIDERECHRMVVVALLPTGKTLDVPMIKLINTPHTEHLTLEHKIDVAVVVGSWRAIDFYRIEMPQAKPVAYVAVIVGATAQGYQRRHCQDNMCSYSFHLKREIAIIKNRDKSSGVVAIERTMIVSQLRLDLETVKPLWSVGGFKHH